MHMVVSPICATALPHTLLLDLLRRGAPDGAGDEPASWSLIYVIPRWQTVSGSQYAYSPATVAALPDARLIQAMTLTFFEAGEKATNPPMVGYRRRSAPT
jgi:hypothetical protein